MSLSLAKKFLVLVERPNVRFLHFSPSVFGTGLVKPKKAIDPSVIHAKIERKKQRIIRDIQKIQKQGRKLKPIDELILKPELRKDVAANRRYRKESETKLSFEESERRHYLLKDYQVFVCDEFKKTSWRIGLMMRRQEKALAELKLESEELYQAALQPLNDNFKQTYKGPLDTPAIDQYSAMEGTYVDTTKNWDKGSTATEFLIKKVPVKKKIESQEEMFLKQAKLIGDQKLIQSLSTKGKKKK